MEYMAREMNLGFRVLIGVVWMEPLLEDTEEEKRFRDWGFDVF